MARLGREGGPLIVTISGTSSVRVIQIVGAGVLTWMGSGLSSVVDSSSVVERMGGGPLMVIALKTSIVVVVQDIGRGSSTWMGSGVEAGSMLETAIWRSMDDLVGSSGALDDSAERVSSGVAGLLFGIGSSGVETSSTGVGATNATGCSVDEGTSTGKGVSKDDGSGTASDKVVPKSSILVLVGWKSSVEKEIVEISLEAPPL